MPTNAYSVIAKQTVTVATTSVTFTALPQQYTDLEIVISGTYTNPDNTISMQFNGDTTGAYYDVDGYANGSATGSYRRNAATYMQTGWYPYPSSQATPGISRINIFNYSKTTMNKTVLDRSGIGGGQGVYMRAGTWVNSNRDAITSITFTITDSGNIEPGTTISIYGISAAPVSPKATGGAIYSDAEYFYHVFGTTATFTPLQSLTCDTLIVAGGGGGGARVGGGGGAGGYRLLTGVSASATPYTITVGAGGAGQIYAGANSTSGSNSSALGNSATGGGYGGMYANYPGASGGSGGGANGNGASVNAGGTGNAGGYSPVEGYAGGSGFPVAYYSAGGGGGGAAGAGVNGQAFIAGNGGAAIAVDPVWLAATGVGYAGYIAGGGGGGTETYCTVGVGGGGGAGTGSNSSSAATSGLAGTGSGGGGGGCCSSNQNGGNGGSGVVIVRYKK